MILKNIVQTRNHFQILLRAMLLKCLNMNVSPVERCDLVGVKLEKLHELFHVCHICTKGIKSL